MWLVIRKQLKHRMKNELKITGKEMAARINRSQSALSSYFSGKDELDFYNLSLLVKELYPDPYEHTEVVKKVALSLERPDNIKCAIEGASFRENIEVLEELLVNTENHSNRDLHEWSRVYRVHLKFLKKEISAIEMANLARQLNIKKDEEGSKKENKNEELLFFQKWMETYGCYLNKEFLIMPSLLRELELLLNNVNDQYIKNTYSTKFYLQSANYNLFNNCIEKAKKYYNLATNTVNLQKVAHAYHGLGLCFMLEDKETSYKYFKKAINLFNDIENNTFAENAMHAFNMVSNLHNDEEFYIYNDCTGLRIEKAHRYIRKGDKHKASELLNSLDFDSLDRQEKAFYSLYKGILDDNIDELYMSLMYFKQSGSKFYATLPCKELIKRNERKAAIYAAYGEIFDI
ncbi:hypothetical protein COE51_01220 [Bacillus pseudomycoides]|nr:hypothetical protein COE51_01220 [Bacillus pseudomycoides]